LKVAIRPSITCREAKTPQPRIQLEVGELSVEFTFSAAYVDRMAAQETTQEQILCLLRKDPTLTRKALADRIGITADGVKYHLDRLRDVGRIRHVGPTKKGRWEVIEPGEGKRSEKPTGG
jgi:ATP-dependent DNA helicase RecG